MRSLFVVLTLSSLYGCQHLPMELSNHSCLGDIPSHIDGLEESKNSALLAQAQFDSGKGGVCEGRVFAVQKPITVYRVFDSSKPYSKFGGWWALSAPSASRDEYRTAYAICPEWSALDRVTACELRPGSSVVIGNTQSAVCADGKTLNKTAALQVFVPNNGKVGIIHTGACSEEKPWPSAP